MCWSVAVDVGETGSQGQDGTRRNAPAHPGHPGAAGISVPGLLSKRLSAAFTRVESLLRRRACAANTFLGTLDYPHHGTPVGGKGFILETAAEGHVLLR